MNKKTQRALDILSNIDDRQVAWARTQLYTVLVELEADLENLKLKLKKILPPKRKDGYFDKDYDDEYAELSNAIAEACCKPAKRKAAKEPHPAGQVWRRPGRANVLFPP